MRSETLINPPPTPPNIKAELQSGHRQLVHYGADHDYPYDAAQSHGTGYASPGLAVHNGFSQHPSHVVDSQHNAAFGLGGQYVRNHPVFIPDHSDLTHLQDGYGQVASYYQDGPYNGLPVSQKPKKKRRCSGANKKKSDQAIASGSPPTPRSATEIDDSGRRTRSGRTIAQSGSPLEEEKPRPKATPKSKKAKAGKSDVLKTPKLTVPLSILTKDMTSIPVRNMEEWVNRSVETRREEVGKRDGYVTRPMNSFMLYRSAYTERTKQWCFKNNHQVVSAVCGESWPLEPPEIRDLYNEYAKIERINHQNAHPNYKFSPSKTLTPARKRKGEFSDEDEPSDLEDAEWNPGHGRSRIRHSRRPERTISYPSHSMSVDFFDRSFDPNGVGLNKSSWEMTNEGRPMPMPMGQGDPYNQYYQTSVQMTTGMDPSMLEDLRMRRVDTPASMQFSADHALLGLPGGNTTSLMQQMYSHAGTSLSREAQVDPMLLGFAGGHHHDMAPSTVPHPEFRNGHLAMMDRELDQHSVDSLLTGHVHEDFQPESWQPDPNMGPIEHESEFEKWMGEH